MSAYLSIEGVGVTFRKGAVFSEVLRDVDLSIDRSEYVSIIGHSGCGKCTLLNVVGGLAEATRGGAILNRKGVAGPDPERAIVFQNHSLPPWLTCYENVKPAVDKAFGSIKSPAERREWTMHNLQLVQMTHAASKRPGEVSGGMKQRAGIARAQDRTAA